MAVHVALLLGLLVAGTSGFVPASPVAGLSRKGRLGAVPRPAPRTGSLSLRAAEMSAVEKERAMAAPVERVYSIADQAARFERAKGIFLPAVFSVPPCSLSFARSHHTP